MKIILVSERNLNPAQLKHKTAPPLLILTLDLSNVNPGPIRPHSLGLLEAIGVVKAYFKNKWGQKIAPLTSPVILKISFIAQALFEENCFRLA